MATQSIERVMHARETTATDQMKRKFTNSGIFAILSPTVPKVPDAAWSGVSFRYPKRIF